ncbi:MAG: hypothetical protein ABL930_04590 [Pseudobdellovibrio sp.]
MKLLLVISALVIAGCSSSTKSEYQLSRKVIDSSKIKSEWVEKSQLAWEAENKYYSKASHTIRGDQQLNACYDLAKLDLKENLITEISSDIKGTIDNAQMSISENAETILGKARSGKWEGTIYGFRVTEQYFERYLIGGVERIDCFVLTELSKQDYDKTKRSVVDKIVPEDPRIKEAIAKKQINFFAEESRKPSSGKAQDSE